MRAKDFIPASKPRNLVAKNSKTAGAGAHKDKKRAEKQGDVKHKNKQYAEGYVTKKSQPYNDPNWTKKLPKEKLDTIAGPRYKKDKKEQGKAES